MILLHPKQGVGNKEALYLRTTIIKIYCSPATVVSPLNIIRFIKILTIKIPKALIILTKMSRHPIHDNTNTCLMCFIHQITEIIRCTITAGYRIIASSLIPPGAIKWMLTKRHKLHMSIVHALYIIHQLVSHFTVGKVVSLQCTAPRAKMHFIGKHWPTVGWVLLLEFKPLLVLPLVIIKVINYGSRLWFLFSKKSIWVGFHNMWPFMLWQNSILINSASAKTWNKQVPDFSVAQLRHFVYTGIPVVKITNYRYLFGMGRPNRKSNSLLTILCHYMCTKHFVSSIICPLMKQEQIKLAKFRCIH